MVDQSITLPETLSEDEAKELFAHFGKAIYASNILEHGIANTIFILEMLPKISSYRDPSDWESDVESFYQSCFDMTLGNLIRRLEKIGELDISLRAVLNNAKHKRDHLVHHFNREMADNWFTPGGRTLIIDECNSAAQFFESADKELENFVKPFAQAAGIDEAAIERELAARMQSVINDQ